MDCDVGNVNYFFPLARPKVEKMSFNYVQKNCKLEFNLVHWNTS